MSKKHSRNNRDQHNSGGMAEQIRNASANGHLQVRGGDGRLRYTNPRLWKGDGIDHININFRAETELGKKLEFAERLPFDHSIFLNFATISGYWAYLRSTTEDDRFRTLVGRLLQNLIHQTKNKPVDHLKAIVMDGAYQRVKQHPRVQKMLFECELPFDMYSISDQGVYLRHAHYEWIVPGYDEIRRAVQSGEEPNFLFLCDFAPKKTEQYPNGDIYESVRPEIPDVVKRRQQALADKRKNKSETPKPQAAPKPAARVVEPPKPAAKPVKTGTNSFTFDPNDGYCQLVPAVTTHSTDIFLEAFRKKLTINGVELETGALETGIRVPLLQISDLRGLFDQGLISDDDVVRSGPVMANTFQAGVKTNTIIRLDSFVVGTRGEDGRWKDSELTNIPLLMRIFDKAYDKPEETQTMEVNEDGVITVARDVVVTKQLQEITTASKQQPAFVTRLLRLRDEQEGGEQFRFALMKLNLVLKIRTDVRPEIFLEGSMTAIGLANGPIENKQKQSRLLSETPATAGGLAENEALPTLELAGYTFNLFRGLLKSIAMAESDRPETAPESQHKGAVSMDASGEVILRTESLEVDSDLNVSGDTVVEPQTVGLAAPVEEVEQTSETVTESVSADETPE